MTSTFRNPSTLITQRREKLIELLSGDLDFHKNSSREFTHDLHAFPAKFPPQLPRLFIQELTEHGDRVLDPMAGSGTTTVEAYVANRRALAFDIDPLALRLNEIKTSTVSPIDLLTCGRSVLHHAKTHISQSTNHLFDEKTSDFIDYWFHPDAQQELTALLNAIHHVPCATPELQKILLLTFSAIIITKSGGVSMALDLAHTRPHRRLDKPYRSPFVEFEKRLKKIAGSLNELPDAKYAPYIAQANAQVLPLADETVDLIVTSPPYPATAIDYMRAHKFSLVWLGYQIESLSNLRASYVGSESTKDYVFEALPLGTNRLLERIAEVDNKKSLAVRRYYSEMHHILGEMYRVLKPGKSAILVVGSSVIRGIDTEVHTCLAEIGETLGFEVPHIGIRNLDRDRRMLPVFRNSQRDTQIEKRMHTEQVIGFWKPFT